MLRPCLQAKIYPLVVTDKNIEYDGSLGLSPALMNAADLIPGQVIQVVNLNNGSRFETYLIEGEDGFCVLNGGAARLGEVGDRLIVMAFVYLEGSETFEPRIIKVDSNNLFQEKQ